MTPEIPDTPIGLAFALFFLLAQLGDRAIRGWLWRMHQADKAAHVAELAKAPENVRAVIEQHEPDPPPGFGPLALVLAGGALASLLAGAARGELQLARRLVAQDELQASSVKYCTSNSDCTDGTCENGQCVPAKQSKPNAERRRPRVVAGLQDGALCTGCDDTPLVTTPVPIPAFAAMR